MSPQPAKMSAQQARGITEFLLADLQQEMGTTIRVIEAAEGGKLDYAPDPKAATGIGLIRHIVTSDAWFLNGIASGVFGSGEESAGTKITTPAEGAALYKATIPAAMERVRALPDAKLTEESDFFNMKMSPVVLLSIMIKHSVHHRGQLSTYLRPMGCKVPGIYGPSADTQ